MIEEFISKYKNNEYISNYLYDQVKNDNKIPDNFDIDEYNNKVLDKLYIENKNYFDNMYKGIDDNIHLDEEQCKAILADEKYSLIIAGAGTGKTTTMVSKVKYLVDKKKANPERILVMSYTRKSTEEIARKIEENFELPVYVTTFHSLGYDYIKEIFKDRKCIIIDRNKLNEIYLNYFSEIYKDKKRIKEILENFEFIKEDKKFIFSKYFINNYEKYDTYDEFIEAYVHDKLIEAKNTGISKLIEEWVNRQLLKDDGIKSINGEYVKSAGEMVIANFLYTNGIDYLYENVYDELLEYKAIYKPDFTIDYGGEKIYIEYYGLDDNKYNKIRKWKETFHKKRHNKYIEINRLPLEKIIEELDNKLRQYNIKYNKLSDEIIYERILRLNPISQVFPFLHFLRECINAKKESIYRNDNNIVDKYINSFKGKEKRNLKIQYKYIKEFEEFYYNSSFGGKDYYFDFSDLLYYSVKYLEKITIDNNLIFDYIIIDEYQDISKIKYELTYKTAKKNNAKVYAVGDDWQTIYSFSGSRIEYIYNFENYFKGSKKFKITRTYRNSQELINISGKFIMRNDDQIKKQLTSNKHISYPIMFRMFDGKNNPTAEIECLKKVILEIHKNNPKHNILVLGRTNGIIHNILEDDDLLDSIGSKVIFKGYENIDIDSMTMHKSKGLTYDEVILIGLNSHFPCENRYNHWYIELYKNKPIKEAIPNAEERRLFYVALTRTKNRVFLLANKNSKYRSKFLNELYSIVYDK